MADLTALREEQRRREVALQEVSEKVKAIEETERAKREAAEQKARELAALQEKLRSSRELTSAGFVSVKLDELRETCEGLAEAVCESDGSGELLMRLLRTSEELLAWERVREFLEERAAAFESQILAMREDQ